MRISLADGRTSEGVAAEALAAKWFEKSPEFTDAQNLDQLRQSLDIAIELYRAQGFDKPFDLFAGTYAEQQTRGAELGLNPLVAAYGPALLDRAILDALGKATGKSFAAMIAGNLPGIRATALTPDIKDAELQPFLAGLKPGRSIEVRHTVGLVDPLTAADRPASERVNDGLPETLEEVVSYYRGRYYKLKVGGDVKADLDRLARIAAVLDAGAGDYRVTFDGNEQYDDVEGIVELWRKVEETPALARLVKSTLFIEQPIKRAVGAQPAGDGARQIPAGDHRRVGRRALDVPGGAEARLCRRVEQELQGLLQVDPQCRARRQAGRGYFMSAEDLTTWPGVSVQQDLALVSLLGLTHVERNAHHFIDGMSFAPEAEQQAFVAAHPDLYERSPASRPACGGRAASWHWARSAARASPSAPISISSRCGRCRRAQRRIQ